MGLYQDEYGRVCFYSAYSGTRRLATAEEEAQYRAETAVHYDPATQQEYHHDQNRQRQNLTTEWESVDEERNRTHNEWMAQQQARRERDARRREQERQAAEQKRRDRKDSRRSRSLGVDMSERSPFEVKNRRDTQREAI